MNFELSEELIAVRDLARDFAEKEIAPTATQDDKEHKFRKDLLLKMGELGFFGSVIPENFDFYKPVPPPVFDRAKAKQLLAEAGHPNGFDAGFYTCDVAYANLGEAAINDLAAVGIRAKLRPLERAAFFKGYGEKKFRGIIQGSSGAFGNAATRLESFVVKGGAYSYGGYPDIDALFPVQATELNREKRAAGASRAGEPANREAVWPSGPMPRWTTSSDPWRSRRRW